MNKFYGVLEDRKCYEKKYRKVQEIGNARGHVAILTEWSRNAY